MATHIRERLVRLEIESATRAQLAALEAKIDRALAWQEYVSRRARQSARAVLWLGLLVGSHYVSGPWAAALKGASKLFAPGLG